jgi:hypothetical protein
MQSTDGPNTTKATVHRTSVIVRLTLLVGACRSPNISKRKIEESLERYIKELSDAG